MNKSARLLPGAFLVYSFFLLALIVTPLGKTRVVDHSQGTMSPARERAFSDVKKVASRVPFPKITMNHSQGTNFHENILELVKAIQEVEDSDLRPAVERQQFLYRRLQLDLESVNAYGRAAVRTLWIAVVVCGGCALLAWGKRRILCAALAILSPLAVFSGFPYVLLKMMVFFVPIILLGVLLAAVTALGRRRVSVRAERS